jgi:hypothetical protein
MRSLTLRKVREAIDDFGQVKVFFRVDQAEQRRKEMKEKKMMKQAKEGRRIEAQGHRRTRHS